MQAYETTFETTCKTSCAVQYLTSLITLKARTSVPDQCKNDVRSLFLTNLDDPRGNWKAEGVNRGSGDESPPAGSRGRSLVGLGGKIPRNGVLGPQKLNKF